MGEGEEKGDGRRKWKMKPRNLAEYDGRLGPEQHRQTVDRKKNQKYGKERKVEERRE